MRRPSVPVAVMALAAIGMAFFVLPLVGLVLRAPWGDAVRSLSAPETLEALKLSLIASLSATGIALVLGVPMAWLYARVEFPGRAVLRALTTLPMVLPPVVGGIALLLAFYLLLETNQEASFVLSLVLLLISLAVLIGLRHRWLGSA